MTSGIRARSQSSTKLPGPNCAPRWAPTTKPDMLLAVSGEQLLLDGSPLDSARGREEALPGMLSAAGIASIPFFSDQGAACQPGRSSFAAFPTGSSSKPAQLAEQLKAALHGDPHIHVNEVCFVPADSAVAKSTVAAQLAARTLGMNSAETDKLLNDPDKLLQLIVAADGMKGGGLGPGGGPGPGERERVGWKRRRREAAAESGSGDAAWRRDSAELARRR